ncbi:PLC-like phosphodiesterase [Phellopilus nigrolimitatus]|nr:PLC-like phosphodiesterase [Phellopilus nigrolimitatus]
MDITLHNLTSTGILAIPTDSSDAKPTLVAAASSASLSIPRRPRRQAGLVLRTETEGSDELCELKAKNLKSSGWGSWALVSDEQEERSAWRVYMTTSSRTGNNGIERKLVILPKRDLSCFLKELNDDRPLSDLCLPGDLSRRGWPIAQCQSSTTPYPVQLQSGIRAFDVRMAVVDGRLVAYHGICPQKTPFQDVLAVTRAFLTDSRTSHETIIMSIKQEDFATTPPAQFSTLVHDEIYSAQGGADMWFLEDRIPSLGEVRGKVIMLSRFGGDGAGWENGLEGMGIHPTTWPDSSKAVFEWTCKDTVVRTSDWYNITSILSIPEKMTLATSVLLPPTPGGYTQPTLNVAFFSAGSVPLALPPTVAQGFGWPKWKLGIEGINSRLGKWLIDQLTTTGAIRGWVFMDFFESPADLLPLLVENNFLTHT